MRGGGRRHTSVLRTRDAPLTCQQQISSGYQDLNTNVCRRTNSACTLTSTSVSRISWFVDLICPAMHLQTEGGGRTCIALHCLRLVHPRHTCAMPCVCMLCHEARASFVKQHHKSTTCAAADRAFLVDGYRSVDDQRFGASSMIHISQPAWLILLLSAVLDASQVLVLR